MDGFGNTGRKMDAAWKRAISEGKKKANAVGGALVRAGNAAVTVGARGAVAAMPNRNVRQRVLGGLAGAATLAPVAGALGAGAAKVGAVRAKRVIAAGFPVKRVTTGLFAARPDVAMKAKGAYIAATKSAAAKGAVAAGAKTLGAAGAIAGGVAGAANKQYGKKINSAVEKRAKRNL